MIEAPAQLRWPDAVDEILAGDQAVVFAYVTPARGVVLTPVTNFALRDREAGTLSAVNSSVGAWKKLERLQRNPQVAALYHTRRYSASDRPEYVLVQGRATIPPLEDRHLWFQELGDAWERFLGTPRDVGPLWERWMYVYHWRVNIRIDVERVVVFEDWRCRGEPTVHGAALPFDPPPAQRPPRNGIGPRVNHERAAARLVRLPYLLAGWVGADGYPEVVPVRVRGTEPGGIDLESPAGLLPPGGRRAGLLGHWFAKHNVPHRLRRHTGWLEGGPDGHRGVYAPHTAGGYALPPWQWSFKLLAGAGTRLGLRQGRRAGVLPR